MVINNQHMFSLHYSHNNTIVDTSSLLNRAVKYFLEDGNFARAAKHLKDIGELWEKEANYTEALQYYEQAADYFNQEDRSR